MSSSRWYRCEALILKNFPMGEADLMVTAYTRERGKIRAVAKGARRSNSRLVGHLEPLTQVRLSLAKGRGLDYVTQAQVIGNFTPLKDGLNGISKGFYLAELVDGFGSEASPNVPLYHLAVETLQSIADDPEADLPLRFFELRLLQVSGLMPELYQCVECRQSLAPGNHRFSPSLGGTLCLNCLPATGHVMPLSLRALKVLRLLDRSRTNETPAVKISESLSRELKSILSTTVEYWLDKQLQSKSLMEQLNSESRPALGT
ncbi:MAG: DNA repair protein RecO [Chloroflexi bacterium]|nr:DNA repair protein RecO [Chloroflexota bacterium]